MSTAPTLHGSEVDERESQRPVLGMSADAGHLEGPVTLRDGTTVHGRAIRPDDTERLRAFHARLSLETIIFRFFGPVRELSASDAERFTHVDRENRMAVVATTGCGSAEQIIGVVRYDRIGPETAEVALVVEDGWQGRGIASQLFRRLTTYARARGFTVFVAVVMASNTRMLALLGYSGLPYTARHEDGCIELRLDIAAPPTAAGTPETASSNGDRDNHRLNDNAT